MLCVNNKLLSYTGAKRVKQFFFFLILGLLINSSSISLRAAEIVLVKNSPVLERGLGIHGDVTIKCDIRLTGTILPGDRDRLKAIVSKFPEYSKIGLCLNSEGGILGEGIKIAKLLFGKGRENKHGVFHGSPSIYTVVKSGDKCLSACSIIFMAGNYFEAEETIGFLTRRYLHVNGQLGFHSPYLNVAAVEYNKESVENAHKTATNSIKEITKLGSTFNPNYMPQSLMTEMLSYGTKEFYKIDTVQKASRYKVELFGVAKPRKLNRCHYDNICYNHLYNDRDNSFLNSSIHKCSKAWRSVRRGSQKLLYGANHGGEGAYYCVLRWSKNKKGYLEYYHGLVLPGEKVPDYGHFLAPNSYYYNPLTLIKTLAR